MWIALWIFVLCLVHIQFRYCYSVAVGFLKIIETSLIVAVVQIYYSDLHVDILQNVTNLIQDLPNLIPRASNDL